MSTQNVMICAMSGLVAGVAIGILFAPAKGSETRRKIADTAESLQKKIRKLRGTTVKELDELAEVFDHEINGLQEDVRKKVLRVIKAARHNDSQMEEEAMS